jgi:serine/threonine protein kinase
MSQDFFVKGYRIQQKLDQMGLRTLYRATHLASNRAVFLVLIQVSAGTALERLRRRAEQSQLLDSPYIQSALDMGELASGGFYYTYPFAETRALSSCLSQVDPGDPFWFESVRYFLGCLERVEYIHRANTAHRDLMTAHFFVDERDCVILDGFINARPRIELRNLAGMVDLPYIAPELLAGGGVADQKADLYSMGVVFYELLTGRLPYLSNYAKLENARRGALPSPSTHKLDVPKELEVLCMRALSARRERFASAREWIDALAAFYDRRPWGKKVKDFSSSLKQMFSLTTR